MTIPPSSFSNALTHQPTLPLYPSSTDQRVGDVASSSWQRVKQPLQTIPQFAVQNMNLGTMVQSLQAVQPYGEELIPVILPNATKVGALFAPCYAGLDIIDQTRKMYQENESLARQERLKRATITAGDVTLLHLIATIGLPLLFSKKIHHFVHHFLEHHPKAPNILKRHPKWTTVAIMLASMLAVSKPIHHMTEVLLDWTYRPLVDKKRRKEAVEAAPKKAERYRLKSSYH